MYYYYVVIIIIIIIIIPLRINNNQDGYVFQRQSDNSVAY